MSGQIGKIIPIAVVGGFMGYLCWPYVGEPLPGPEAKGGGKPPEIAPALLTPPAEPAPDRDPFKTPELPKAPAPPAAEKGKAVTPSPPPRIEPVDLLSGLTLSATLVRGDRRLAVIDGSLYAEGEQMKPSSPTAPSYTLARVYPDKVLLRREGRIFELTYPAKESKQPKAAAEGPKPGGLRAAPQARKP